MKSLGIFATIISIIWISLTIGTLIIGTYQYENEVSSYWELADKASTVVKKSEHIDKFVDALQKSNLQGEYNAIILETPNNSFDNNLEALKTLQQRLQEIQKMDVTSFEYQTAMQQITGQEQGEAKAMLQVFEGVWWKKHHFLLWNWVGGIQITLSIIIGIIGAIIWTDAYI